MVESIWAFMRFGGGLSEYVGAQIRAPWLTGGEFHRTFDYVAFHGPLTVYEDWQDGVTSGFPLPAMITITTTVGSISKRFTSATAEISPSGFPIVIPQDPITGYYFTETVTVLTGGQHLNGSVGGHGHVNLSPTGEIDPNGIPIFNTEVIRLTATPDAGYIIDSFTVDGFPYGSGTPITVGVVDIAYAVTFKPLGRNIVGSVGANGTISPTINDTFTPGDHLSFTFMPVGPDYRVHSATIDGSDVTTAARTGNPVPYPLLPGGVGPDADVTVVVTFEYLLVNVTLRLTVNDAAGCPAGTHIAQENLTATLSEGGHFVTGQCPNTYTTTYLRNTTTETLNGSAGGSWVGQQVVSLTVNGTSYGGGGGAAFADFTVDPRTYAPGVDVTIVAVVNAARLCAVNIITPPPGKVTPPDHSCPPGQIWTGTACTPIDTGTGGGHDCSIYGPDYYWDETVKACVKAKKLTGTIYVESFLDRVAYPMSFNAGGSSGTTPGGTGELQPGVYLVSVTDGATRSGSQSVTVVANAASYAAFSFFTDGTHKGKIYVATYFNGDPYPMQTTINGSAEGLSPVLSVELDQGVYTVSVTDNLDFTRSRSVTVLDNQTVECRFDFTDADLIHYGYLNIKTFYELVPYIMTVSVDDHIIGQSPKKTGMLWIGAHNVDVFDGRGLTGTQDPVVVAGETTQVRFDFFDDGGGTYANGLRIRAQFAGQYIQLPFRLTSPSAVTTDKTAPYADNDVATGVWTASADWRGSVVTASGTVAATGVTVIILSLPGEQTTLPEDEAINGSGGRGGRDEIPDSFQVRWKDESGAWSPWRTVELGVQGHDEPFRWLAPMGIYRHRQYEFQATGISPVVVAWVEEDVESFAPEVTKEVRE